jgi:hypothetical protein
MTNTDKYPNREMSLTELRLADVVKAFDGPWGTAIVKNITKNEVTFFRPYGTTANFSMNSGVICYTGLETFSRMLSSKEKIFVYQREDLK